jgi:MoxR-like ATPases
MEEMFENRTDLSKLSEAVSQMRGAIGRVVVGQTEMVDLMIAGLLCDGHLLIEGVPGVAKNVYRPSCCPAALQCHSVACSLLPT